MKLANYLWFIIIRVIVEIRCFNQILDYYDVNEQKIVVRAVLSEYRYIFIPLEYENKINIMIRIKAINDISFFEILKSAVFAKYFDKTERDNFIKILKNTTNSITTSNSVERRYVRNLLDKFCIVYGANNYISLLFMVMSKTRTYKPSKKLTKTENRILELIFLGSNKSDIKEELSVEQSTITSHLNNIYFKLGVDSIEKTLIKVLKENNNYKKPSELVTDLNNFTVNYK
jgi:DNA-binding CsgD family transcriptional regulator